MYDHFVGYALYAMHLRTILKYFPPGNIRLYLFEDLIETPQRICDDIFNWLNVPPHRIHARVYNSTYQPRSRQLTSLINQFKRPNNPIKRAIRSMLPYPAFIKFSDRIAALNSTRRRFEPIPPNMKLELAKHYKKHNDELRVLLERENLKSCLKIYSRNNWLYHSWL